MYILYVYVLFPRRLNNSCAAVVVDWNFECSSWPHTVSKFSGLKTAKPCLFSCCDCDSNREFKLGAHTLKKEKRQVKKNVLFKKGGYRDGVKRKRDKTGMDYTHGAVR